MKKSEEILSNNILLEHVKHVASYLGVIADLEVYRFGGIECENTHEGFRIDGVVARYEIGVERAFSHDTDEVFYFVHTVDKYFSSHDKVSFF